MILHRKKIRVTKDQVKTLNECGLARDGSCLSGIIYLKSKFMAACSTLDELGIDYEFAGSFSLGVYLETKGFNLEASK